MKCPFCGDEIKQLEGLKKNHLLVAKLADGCTHVHGDIENKEAMREMIIQASDASGVSFAPTALERKEIVFHNRQRIGDILMFTCAVRDFKAAYPDVRVNVISTAGHIWDHNPHIDRTLQKTNDNIVKIGPRKLTNSSNKIDWHFTNAYRVSIQETLGIHIPQGESRPDIWLHQEEYDAPRINPLPYWIIVLNGEKGWGSKMYPFSRFQAFIDQNPNMLFYQVGTIEDKPPRLKGKNVIDFVGQTQSRDTGIRDLFKLFLNAEGSIGLVSFHMHLSGALYKPSIVVAGAREPVSFTRYPGHRYLATDGCLPCSIKNACWKCEIDACKGLKVIDGEKVPACVDMIHPEDLTKALNNYYIGGRLKKDTPSEKPKLKNIVKISNPKTIVQAPVPKDNSTKYGMDFGNTCLEREDWDFIKGIIDEHKVKTVLEFGPGVSTFVLNDYGMKVVSYEDRPDWIEKIKRIMPSCDVRLWNGKDLQLNERFDLAFVDGPSGGNNREISTKVAVECAKIVVIHDANRKYELEWQKKYLQDGFSGPIKGGRRCHLWTKGKAAPKKEPVLATPGGAGAPKPAPAIVGDGLSIKFVSTARGWGGCARSITTLMAMLMKAGHGVEFIPFRNNVGSREFREWIGTQPGLLVTENYDTVKDPCDLLFIYADDFVWEFDRPEVAEIFTGAKAARKIMMLNYRRGPVGKAEWTKGWDKYMFLNSTQERSLLDLLPGIKTKVLAPCTNLEAFFGVKPNYNTNFRIIRHSSQGDTKFSKDFGTEVFRIMDAKEGVKFYMMPGPSFLMSDATVHKFPRNNPPIPEFLAMGNLFWYSLPYGYMDMGPRVIIEAMAAGLPILADNWGGAKDRVTEGTGWLCDTKDEHSQIIKNITLQDLERKGFAARERARQEFTPESWIKELINA